MPKMKCRTCHTSMVVDRQESSDQVTTCWHLCPLCKQVRLTSEPESVLSSQFARELLHTDYDNGYAADFESQPSAAYH